jgi:hypothetical protein
MGMTLEGSAMFKADGSLRNLVEKWLALTPVMPIHVTRFRRTRSCQRLYVRVEASQATSILTIYFFRHGDGTWCVFPPPGGASNDECSLTHRAGRRLRCTSGAAQLRQRLLEEDSAGLSKSSRWCISEDAQHDQRTILGSYSYSRGRAPVYTVEFAAEAERR